MTSFSITRVPERCLWGALLFCTVYQSYRYPLQLNSSGTSPTYSDTPVAFQITKFLIASMICLVTVRYIPGRLLAYRKWVLAALVACMSAYPIFKEYGAEGDRAIYMNIAFWPLAALVLVLSTQAITITALDRYIRFVFLYALASTAVEVLLFLTIGRLPALAYSDSVTVRFGGFLDDPNGFAALVFMLMGWAYYRYSGRRRFLAEAILVLCVLLTQSFTAIGFLGLLALLFFAYHFIRRPRPLLLVSLGAVLLVILSSAWALFGELISSVIEQRRGSVEDHLSQLTAAKANTGPEWLFGGSTYMSYESWWMGSLINFGIPWYLLCVALVATLVYSIFRAFRRARSPRHKAVLSGIFLFSCYFVAGNINLPFFAIFPINFLFFFFAYLIFFERIREEGLQAGEVAGNETFTLADSLHAKAENPLHRPALD